MEIKFKKLIAEAQVPFKKYAPDAGFDLYCTSIVKTPNYIEYHTGLAIEIPTGMVGFIIPRSSISDYDLMLKNSLGIIDATYRGEIMFRFNDIKQYSLTQKKVIYNVGDRIGQIIFLNIPDVTLIEADELSETERGTGGYGASGK